MNYHEILGVSPNATPDEIKKAYRKRAHETHPDKQGGNEEEFKKVNEAYSVLSGKTESQQTQDFGDMHVDLNDILRGFGFGRSHHHYRPQRPPQQDHEIGGQFAASVQELKNGKTFDITYEKSKDCQSCSGVGGKKKNICTKCNGDGSINTTKRHGQMIYTQSHPCQDCHAAGFTIEEPCSICNGEGFTTYSETMTISMKGEVK